MTVPITKLKDYRKNQQPPLSQEALAKHFEVTPATISRWESGTRKPERKHLPEISRLIGVSLEELLCS